MHIVLVNIHVKPEYVEQFKAASLENAKNSVLEPGVVRFDFLQQSEDLTRFLLVEVYRTPEDQLKHRDTRHYQTWRDAVTEMMADPRVGIKYKNIFPEDKGWIK